jgi:hypothetical protein
LEEKAVSLQSVSKIFGNIRRIDYLCPCNSNYKLETKSLKLETRNYKCTAYDIKQKGQKDI